MDCQKNCSASYNRTAKIHALEAKCASKMDKDVVNVMTLAERYRGEGLAEGEARGEAKGEARGEAKGMSKAADQMLALIKSGIDPEEALNIIKSNAEGLATG